MPYFSYFGLNDSQKSDVRALARGLHRQHIRVKRDGWSNRNGPSPTAAPIERRLRASSHSRLDSYVEQVRGLVPVGNHRENPPFSDGA